LTSSSENGISTKGFDERDQTELKENAIVERLSQ